MTVPSSTTTRQRLSCTGAVDYDLAATFKFFDDTDLKVYRVDALGNESLLDLVTDYSVSGGSGASGTVTTVNTFSDGEILVLLDLDATQGYDMIQGDGFLPDELESLLDKQTLVLRQFKEALSRTVSFSEAVDGVSGVITPLEAGYGVKVNIAGDGLTTFPLSSGDVEMTATRKAGGGILWGAATDIPTSGKLATWDGMPWVDVRAYASIQAAMDSGAAVVLLPSGSYTESAMIWPTTLKELRCEEGVTITQASLDEVVLSGTSLSGVKITGSPTIIGLGLTETFSTSTNDAFNWTLCDDVDFSGVIFQNMGGHASHSFGGNRHNANFCQVYNCAAGIYFRGTKTVNANWTRTKGKNVALGELYTALQCATYTAPYGTCEDVNFCFNWFEDLGACQSVLCHSVIGLTAIGNSGKNISAGLALQVFSGQPLDKIQKINVHGNRFILYDGTDTSFSAIHGYGISVSGVTALGDATDVSITDNIVRNSGKQLGAVNSAIRIYGVQGATITGNDLADGDDAGIEFYGGTNLLPLTNIICKNNNIHNFAPTVAGTAGIRLTNAALLDGEFENNITGCYSAYRNSSIQCPDWNVVSKTEHLNTIGSVGAGTNFNINGRKLSGTAGQDKTVVNIGSGSQYFFNDTVATSVVAMCAFGETVSGVWLTATAVTTDDYYINAGKVYQAKTTDTTGATPPTHTTGTVSDGTVDWLFVSNFGGGSHIGQTVLFVFQDSDTTIKENSTSTNCQFSLTGNVDFVGTVRDTLSVVWDGNFWVETARSATA